MELSIRRLTQDDQAMLAHFIEQHWGAPFVVAHGTAYTPDMLEGYIAVDNAQWVGLASFHIVGTACEIVTLNSLREGQGIGTTLIEAVAQEARQRGCVRLWLITTNDNLHALGFYQRRGFALVAVHRNALETARQLKPSISLIGNDGIPLRDEIELERVIP